MQLSTEFTLPLTLAVPSKTHFLSLRSCNLGEVSLHSWLLLFFATEKLRKQTLCTSPRKIQFCHQFSNWIAEEKFILIKQSPYCTAKNTGPPVGRRSWVPIHWALLIKMVAKTYQGISYIIFGLLGSWLLLRLSPFCYLWIKYGVNMGITQLNLTCLVEELCLQEMTSRNS
jgi:hypothetical protein